MRENEPGKAIFITNLKRLLEENNVKQYELAKAIGVTSGVVSFWLKGTNYPRIATMQKIADYFRAPIESPERIYHETHAAKYGTNTSRS